MLEVGVSGFIGLIFCSSFQSKQIGNAKVLGPVIHVISIELVSRHEKYPTRIG